MKVVSLSLPPRITQKILVKLLKMPIPKNNLWCSSEWHLQFTQWLHAWKQPTKARCWSHRMKLQNGQILCSTKTSLSWLTRISCCSLIPVFTVIIPLATLITIIMIQSSHNLKDSKAPTLVASVLTLQITRTIRGWSSLSLTFWDWPQLIPRKPWLL